MHGLTFDDKNRENSHFISERALEFVVSCSRDTLLFTVCWNIVKNRRKLCNFSEIWRHAKLCHYERGGPVLVCVHRGHDCELFHVQAADEASPVLHGTGRAAREATLFVRQSERGAEWEGVPAGTCAGLLPEV